jgi:Fe-S-cluster-containing hydrogenase component 2
MTETSDKRLIIDLEKCDDCDRCGVVCDYYNRPHADEHGMLGLREKAAFAIICRRCEIASCVLACPFDAIERQADGPDRGVIMRYNLRCVSCNSCALACPFGTIYTEMLPFYATHCDHCIDRHDSAPSCVASCGEGALEFRRVDPDEKDVHIIDANLAARAGPWARRWNRNEVNP